MKRRHLLLNGTAALFAVPVLGSLFRSLSIEASAQEPLRLPRFVLYNHANSLQRQKIRETTWDAQSGFDFNGALTPLAPHASDLLITESLYNNVSTYLHGNNSAALSCASRGGGAIGAAGTAPKIVGGITIDQLIAQQIANETTRIPSLVLGNPIAPINGDCVYGTICGTADNTPVFPITNPLAAYEQLFGMPTRDPRVLAQLSAQKSQLDHLRREIAVVNESLPLAQREKLDLYLTSIRNLEVDLARRIDGDDSTCAGPNQPAAVTDNTRANNPALWKTFLDLGIAALRCGITRQLTLLHTYGCIHWAYTFDGERKNHHERVCHQEETGPFMTKILSWHAEQVAYLYSELQASGDGDETVVMWMSDGGGKHHGGNKSYPIVVLGKPGKVLNTGQYVSYPDEEVSLARFHLTMANAFGSNITRFGDGTDPGEEPLSELLA